jgi:hypothetical protein
VVGAAAAALLAGAVALAAVAAHDPAGVRKSATTAAPTPQVDKRAGPVFLEHLPGCTRTDHHHVLTVAFGVSNLGRARLLLLGASPLLSDDGPLRLTRVRVGLDRCADGGGIRPVPLEPSHEAAVAMTFRVNRHCPHGSLVAARVSFDAGAAGIVHSESSALDDLSRLRFVQC